MKTYGSALAAIMTEMYDAHDDERFVALAREMGAAMDEALVATDELFDALREVRLAAPKLVRATWRQFVMQWKMRSMLAAAVRKRAN